MIRYLTLRVLQSILLILGVLILVFFMVRLTGDPASLMMPRDATEEQRQAFAEANGFNRTLGEQFFDYFGDLLRGDLGVSTRLGLSNAALIGQRLPATFELAASSLLLAVVVAVPLGVIAGMNPGTPADFLARLVGLAGQTIPGFWLAMFLILIFAVNLRMLPSFGRDGLTSLILPAVALSLGSMGQLVRLTRAVVLEVRNENYLRTARAKGLTERWVAMRHIAPNTAIPLISVIGLNFTYLLGGSVYIETIFAWPGLGGLLTNAINDSDYPLVQAITIFIALFAIGIQLLTDMLYGWLDPRIRQR